MLECGAYQPKIEEEYRLLVDQSHAAIRGLNVAVDEAELMHLGDGVDDLHAQDRGRAQAEGLCRREPAHVREVLAEQLHHEVVARRAAVAAHLDKASDGAAALQ